MLTTQAGRERFWAESAPEKDSFIYFSFINGAETSSQIITHDHPSLFKIEYFGSKVSFHLQETKDEGTDLTVTNTGISEEEYEDVLAGWVAVLMALKAAADHCIDIRNHNPQRSWDQGFVDN